MKVGAIVQARMGSSRFPGKVMKPVVGMPMIELLLKRLKRSVELDQIVVATSVDERNQSLVDHVAQLGFCCERGSEVDVMNRYLDVARKHNIDVIVRITGDCPLVDPSLVDDLISRFRKSSVDYMSNCSPPFYPDGLDIEVFTSAALERAAQSTAEPYDHEHVTPFIRESGHFETGNVSHTEDLSDWRWTVDEPEDLDVITRVFEHFSPDIHFNWQKIVGLARSHPHYFSVNRSFIRNAGANMSSGQKLWRRAKQVIPGGNMLLSKRAEMFLPEQWPTYFSRAKGCQVWDMDGNQFTDMSIMGIGTNILGYGNDEVDDAVRSVIDMGNMSTFNAPEEVYLAEKLIELHPWADMVRFARSGGEANAIAIRIARAAVGKEKVAVCGYHGWHDWYLSANLGDSENLAGHLLPGLSPKGVPGSLKGTIFPFNYNNYMELENLVSEHDIGVIKMEVARNMGPENDFLHKVRKLATDKGIVLIFDECTSGFREAFGGLHMKYGVEPDMAMFGKALGNGYAITATIGKREVMEAAQSTFISSTFWTERIGSVAALKTLEVMERVKSWETITQTGIDIRNRWQNLANKHELDVTHFGLPALTGFSFTSNSNLSYKTLITQEMLAKGYLAGNAVYVCTEHSEQVIESYFASLDPIFSLIKECEEGRSIDTLLNGPICHDGFKRLN